VPVRYAGRIVARLDDLARRLRVNDPVKVRAGFLEGRTYPDGTPVALVAAIQDAGSPANNIPPRPFFRNMIADKGGEWPDALEKALEATDNDVERALGIVGEGIAGQLRQSIVDTNDPPNAPSTLRRKKGTKPLVDTGLMLASIDKEVVSG
jgi:hypothetical protein